ncbi:right-handed parallel beta-helix repeat-containing protein [Opitutus sp. ER46]|uniref:right-handed parallel beta-helix repeat-containing protein n=1 Tax=Opitutus sp. ER46 TaxID=2161864 RepID=UPI000D3272BF|nr:right-handed parallel beta-helix repeat-containing protein [Opitutus sp. ER46]PTX94381.1 hypothetical protein DB354_11545 [Opitutus sp. ER46]
MTTHSRPDSCSRRPGVRPPQIWRGWLAGLGLALVTATGFAAPAEFWVAPDGNDRADGTREQPLASPGMALRKVRELRRLNDAKVAEGGRIILRGGVYQLAEPLFVRVEDTATAVAPTIFESAVGEQAWLSGGVPVGGWTKAEAVEGLPTAARGQVWVAEAPKLGGRPLALRDLWVKGSRATRARTPNGGEMSQLVGWDRKEQFATIPATLVSGLRGPGALEMVVAQQWEVAFLRVKALTVTGETAKVTFMAPESAREFQHPWPQPILPPEGGGAFHLANAIEFLDAPGEWFQDPANGRIYYWPERGQDPARDEVTVPVLEQLVRVLGTLDRPVEHVYFRNVGFAHSSWLEPNRSGHVPLQAGMPIVEAYGINPPGTPDKKSLENQAWIERIPAAVAVSGARHVGFLRCEFRHTAASALDLVDGVQDALVEGCRFTDVGGNGIQLGSFQEGGVETHVPYAPQDDRVVVARVRIANNVLRDTANVDWGCVAIGSGYAREIAIEHNDIADSSYTGISVGWGWTKTVNASRDNRVHANRIRRVATRLCDIGGVYTLSAQAGTRVTENVVDEIVISRYVDRPNHWFYLYTDEGSSNVTVRDNWCPEDKFLQNANGPGNVWENNGPQVSPEIKRRAGVQAAFKDLVPADPEPRTVDTPRK